MADFRAIHSVGSSMVTYLRNAYPLKAEMDCDFTLLSSGEMTADYSPAHTLSLYLYRININEHLRNRVPAMSPSDSRTPLALDLHYLLTAWANTASEEQLLLAWAMRQLHSIPVLDVSSLSPDGGWKPGDVVHWIPAEITHEDMTRIWSALIPPYRLSFPYIARVVLLDPAVDEPSGAPVVANRFGFSNQGPAQGPAL